MKMKITEKSKLIFINIICIVVLAAVVCPLLLISKYNYPTADDWSFGVYVYRALQNHEGIIGVLQAVIYTVTTNYMNWEGRFAIPLLSSFQPGVFGEKYYGIVAYLMLGSLIISEVYLVHECLQGKNCKDNGGNGSGSNGLVLLPISVPVIALQILYCPYPDESFYWYNGGINYTFLYALALILVSIIICLGIREMSKGKYIGLTLIACVLAALIGGGNMATSLSLLCTLVVADILFFFFRRPAFWRVWFIALPAVVTFLAGVLSPGAQKRIAANFDGEVLLSPIEAIGMSFVRSFWNIYGWTDWKVLFVCLLILPFLWKAVRNISYHFKYPALFTLLTFALYSSQITATLYVDGTTGGGRQGAILWYSYLIWIVGNECYWAGWLQRKCKGEIAPRILSLAETVSEKYLLLYCAACGVMILGSIYLSGIGNTTSFRAYRLWKNGWAQQYGAAWEERLKVLHDDSIKQVEFKPLEPVDMLMYTDLQPETGYYWVTTACANYYEKEYIHIVTEEENHADGN